MRMCLIQFNRTHYFSSCKAKYLNIKTVSTCRYISVMSQIVLFLHSALVLSFYTDVVLTLSSRTTTISILQLKNGRQWAPFYCKSSISCRRQKAILLCLIWICNLFWWLRLRWYIFRNIDLYEWKCNFFSLGKFIYDDFKTRELFKGIHNNWLI